MASFLVMKNNLSRILVKKSTYLIMIFMPILLILLGSLSVRLGECSIRVGVEGSQQFSERVQNQFLENEHIAFQFTVDQRRQTDQIMGKYDYVISESTSDVEQKAIISNIQQALSKSNPFETNALSATQRMITMLLTVYMTIGTIYGMKYHQDKRAGVVERFNVSVSYKSRYWVGFFLSNVLITGFQVLVILTFWTLLDKNFTLSFTALINVYLFILVVSNAYAILITVISRSELMSGILGASLAVLLSILGGTFVAVENMPTILQQIGIISPIRWLLEML